MPIMLLCKLFIAWFPLRSYFVQLLDLQMDILCLAFTRRSRFVVCASGCDRFLSILAISTFRKAINLLSHFWDDHRFSESIQI